MKEKAAPILKHFIDPEIAKVIINIWELMTAINGQPGTNVVREDQTVGNAHQHFHERHRPARMRAESMSMTLWLEEREEDGVRGRSEPRCTTKNILELTIARKINQLPIIPDALLAASIAMGCVSFRHARLREIFAGSDRERREHIGGDMTIIREVDAQLNDLNKAFPVIAKAWELKLPAINMCAISVAPRGEDRAKETTNRLLWESFIVIQDNQTADTQQQRVFINNFLYSKDGTKKFIDIFDENFGEDTPPPNMLESSFRTSSRPLYS